MLERELDHVADDQLEARHRAADARLRQIEQLQRGGRRGHADERGFHRARAREQLQHRGGDDAERAFGADENLAQVVAGVVLLQLREKIHDAAVGQHDLEPEHEIARDAVGQRAGAAGIGREIAADGAAAFRAERERKQPVDRGRRLLRFGQHDAGLAGHRVRCGIDLADPVEPREREDHSPSKGICPPTRPVLPPCGTSGVLVSLASLRIACTSATEPGRSNIDVRP